MGKGATLPNYTAPQLGGFGIENIQGGKGVLDEVWNKRNEGLPTDVLSRMQRQGLGGISGNLQAGLNQINQGFSGSGLSQGARLGAISDLYQGSGRSQIDLQDRMANMNYQAKQQNYGDAFNRYMSLINQAAGIGQMQNQNALASASMQNQWGMNKYNIDKQNEFSWGDALGSLLGAGGMIGGAMLGKV